MKYLKRYEVKFNEAKHIDTSIEFKELEDFTNLNLIFLLDENFLIKFHQSISVEYNYEVNKVFIHRPNYEQFSWVDISENILQYLDMLREKFTTRALTIRFVNPNASEDGSDQFNTMQLDYKDLDKLDEEIKSINLNMTFIDIEVLINFFEYE